MKSICLVLILIFSVLSTSAMPRHRPHHREAEKIRQQYWWQRYNPFRRCDHHNELDLDSAITSNSHLMDLEQPILISYVPVETASRYPGLGAYSQLNQFPFLNNYLNQYQQVGGQIGGQYAGNNLL